MDVATELVGLLKAKGVSPRARRKFFRCSPRRARSDNFYERREHDLPRIVALEHVFSADETDEVSVTRINRAEAKRRRKTAKRLRQHLVAELNEVQQVRALEEQLREKSQKDLAVLGNPDGFEMKVEELAADPEIGSHSTAVKLEQIELEVLPVIAAA